MYVLHHADKPEIYANLPKDPRISPIVEMWKGAGNIAGLAAIGVFAAIGFVHHLVTGANRVSREDEEKRQAADRGSNRHDALMMSSRATASIPAIR